MAAGKDGLLLSFDVCRLNLSLSFFVLVGDLAGLDVLFMSRAAF